jgi:Arc/MetJ family transcription regulator
VPSHQLVIPVVLPSHRVTKISISIDDDLYHRVRDAAGTEGVSGWLASAAATRLRMETLQAVSDEIADATGGPYSQTEIERAREWLPSSSTPAG